MFTPVQLQTAQAIGTALVGLGIVVGAATLLLYRVGLLHFGKKEKECESCSTRTVHTGTCPEHGVMVESFRHLKEQNDKIENKLTTFDTKLDEVVLSLAYLRGRDSKE